MDSFKFNSLNYQDTNSLVEAQNKVIDDLMKDNKVLSQDRANYATFRAKESERQLKQLGNIIAGVPKLKKEIEAAKIRREGQKEVNTAESNKGITESDWSFSNPDTTSTTSTNINNKEQKLKEEKNQNEREIVSIITNPDTPQDIKTVAEKTVSESREKKVNHRNSSAAAKNYGNRMITLFMGEGQAYNEMSEKGGFRAVEEASENFKAFMTYSPEYQAFDRRNRRLVFDTYRTQYTNYVNQASRSYIAKTKTVYDNTRRFELKNDIDLNAGEAIQDYIFKHEVFGNKKDTNRAWLQLRDDLLELEKTNDVKAETYSKILSAKIIDRSSKKEKTIADLNNSFSSWAQGRQVTLTTEETEFKIRKWKSDAQLDIEKGEKDFEQWQLENPGATTEEEFEWRKTWLTGENGEGGAYRRNPNIFPGDPIWSKWNDGLTRLDGPDHSITLEKLVDDYNNNAPLDDAMYRSLPDAWKRQFHKATKGTDGEEGSSGESIGTGKLTFKSYFNALKDGGGWDTWVMDQMRISDVAAAKSNPRFGWIVFQGKEDYVTKFEELKTKGSVRDAQAGALAFIKGKYKEYYNNPIEEGFDTRITSSITEGRRDIIPRLRGKSQDDKLAVLNQPTFWDGEEVAFEELMKWSKGYGEFPQYYKQVDDNLFKDMTPRDIALHRMEINKERIEKKEDFNNALKAIYKGVELDNKLYNSLPLDTSRLLTNHNTAGRTYRAEVQEKDNTELYEYVKVNDDPNAYKPANPYSDHVPSGNLSEMPLIEVLTESGQKRLKALGLYALNPRDIMNVISEEEKTNGFLDTTFDEKLQTELKRRLARLSANRANQYSALTESPNPFPNIIEEDALTLTEMFGPQDWYTIPPNTLQEYLKELQKQN